MNRRIGMMLLVAVAACSSADEGDIESSADATVAGDVLTDEDGAPPDADGPATACIDFQTQLQPIFSANCIGCHSGAGASAGLDLSDGAAHGSLVGVPAQGNPQAIRVVPGDAGASWLLTKLGPTPPVGAQMPMGGSPLPEADRALTAAWIDQGALAEPAPGCDEPTDPATVTIGPAGPLQIEVAELKQLAAQAWTGDGTPTGGTVLWQTSNSHHVYVDKTGQLLGITPGVAEVTATIGGSSATVSVTVVSASALAPATFTADARPVFLDSCALSGCHVDGVEPGDLRFDRPADQMYEKLVLEEAEAVTDMLIQPSSPLGSYVFRKIIDPAPAAGAQMPFGTAPLDAAKAQIILRWIVSGAGF